MPPSSISSSPSETLHTLLQALIPLTAEDYEAFAAALHPLTLEKREWLLRERPELVQRVSQRLLASHLGIKPESLSWIRGRS